LELYKAQGKIRYSELKNNLLDISPKILSARLRELEKQGLITKDVDITVFPVKCEYALTDSGKDFIRVIKDIKKWALQWKYHNKDCAEQDCKYCDM